MRIPYLEGRRQKSESANKITEMNRTNKTFLYSLEEKKQKKL